MSLLARKVSSPFYWTLTNTSDQEFYIPDLFQHRNYSEGHESDPWYYADYMAGVELHVQETGKRYLPLTDPADHCVCAQLTVDSSYLPAGKSIRGYNVYYVPQRVEEVRISFPGFDVMKNVPAESIAAKP